MYEDLLKRLDGFLSDLPALLTEEEVLERLLEASKGTGVKTVRAWDVLFCPYAAADIYVLRKSLNEDDPLGHTIRDMPIVKTNGILSPSWFSSKDKKVRREFESNPWWKRLGSEGTSWIEVPIAVRDSAAVFWSIVFDEERHRRPSPKAMKELGKISSLTGLKIQELREMAFAAAAERLFVDPGGVNPVHTCLRALCETLNASLTAYFRIDPISGTARKSVEVYFDGKASKIIELQENETYELGENLTGKAVDSSSYNNIPDLQELKSADPELINPTCDMIREDLLGVPLRSALYRTIDVPGSFRGMLRIVNRSDNPRLSFTGHHHRILDSAVGLLATIVGTADAAARIECVDEATSRIAATPRREEESLRLVDGLLRKIGFPVLIVTEWGSEGIVREAWATERKVARGILESRVRIPDILKHSDPWLQEVSKWPSRMVSVLDEYPLVYVVPTSGVTFRGGGQEATVVMIPLVLRNVDRRLTDAFWRARPNLKTFLAIMGHIIGNARKLTKNMNLLYLAEQAVGTIGHEIRSPAASLQSEAQELAFQALRAVGQLERREKPHLRVRVTKKKRTLFQELDSLEKIRGWMLEKDRSIERNSAFLSKVIGDALQWARLSGRTLEAHFRECKFDEILGAAIESLSPELESKPWMRIEIKGNPGIQLTVDEFYIEILLLNLLDNAIKYSWKPGGNLRGDVLVVVEPQPSLVDIKVTNWGMGIKESEYETVFSSFYRTVVRDRVHTVRGVGLGLATCLKIVRIHKGHIGVVSRPTLDDPMRRSLMEGYRTTFTVRLRRDLRPGRVDIDSKDIVDDFWTK